VLVDSRSRPSGVGHRPLQQREPDGGNLVAAWQGELRTDTQLRSTVQHHLPARAVVCNWAYFLPKKNWGSQEENRTFKSSLKAFLFCEAFN